MTDDERRRLEAVEIMADAALRLAANNHRRTNAMAKKLSDVERDVAEALKQIDTFTTDVANDLDTIGGQLTAIRDQIAAGELVPAAAFDGIVRAVQNRAEALRVVAGKVENPVPPAPPPVEPLPPEVTNPTPEPTDGPVDGQTPEPNPPSADPDEESDFTTPDPDAGDSPDPTGDGAAQGGQQ